MYAWFKGRKNKEYLGFCKEKGYIYSVEAGIGVYKIIAIKDGAAVLLLEHKIKEDK